MVSAIVASNDESLKRVYDAIDADIAALMQESKDFYTHAGMVQADLSRCINDPSIPPEMKKDFIDQEMRVLQYVKEKDTEGKQQRKAAVRVASEKDAEKRQFNWNALATAGAVVFSLASFAFCVLGGNTSIRLPRKL